MSPLGLKRFLFWWSQIRNVDASLISIKKGHLSKCLIDLGGRVVDRFNSIEILACTSSYRISELSRHRC